MTVPIYILAFIILMSGLLKEINSHTHHLHNTQKEREEDGSISPRDHGHYEGGEHMADFDHEAIIGSAKEAEDYDELPPEEAKRRLEILLKKMDRNGDLSIDTQELHSWILRSFRMLSEEESADRLEDMDLNSDSSVTWEEYIGETYGIKDPEDVSLLVGEDKDEERKLMEEDRQLFNEADTNLDGRLEIDEFLAFSHPEEDPKMLPILLQQTLNDKDSDKDGFISFQEFIGSEGKEKDKEWLLTEKDRFDNELDKDQDGILNRDEILSWVVPSNDDIAKEEVEHLFASADDDNDEILTFAEILEHYHVFVGSEVTDYGDHLHNLERFDDEL